MEDATVRPAGVEATTEGRRELHKVVHVQKILRWLQAIASTKTQQREGCVQASSPTILAVAEQAVKLPLGLVVGHNHFLVQFTAFVSWPLGSLLLFLASLYLKTTDNFAYCRVQRPGKSVLRAGHKSAE